MIYEIEIRENYPHNAVDVYVRGHKLDPKDSQKIRNHSPDGFNVGYHGSGPAQCALGILLYVLPRRLAEIVYQDFKNAHVSTWKVGKTYHVDIEEWVAVNL